MDAGTVEAQFGNVKVNAACSEESTSRSRTKNVARHDDIARSSNWIFEAETRAIEYILTTKLT